MVRLAGCSTTCSALVISIGFDEKHEMQRRRARRRDPSANESTRSLLSCYTTRRQKLQRRRMSTHIEAPRQQTIANAGTSLQGPTTSYFTWDQSNDKVKGSLTNSKMR